MPDLPSLLDAALIGVIEGLTEFLPVSSTGHILLGEAILGMDTPPGRVFEVVIQLGAILAVIAVYWNRLWGVARNLFFDWGAAKFAGAVLLGFLPSAVLGLLLHKYIKLHLFSVPVVCVMLILGGIAILLLERRKPENLHDEIERFSPRLSLMIGLFQCLALIPGVSRSGATILGAVMLGVTRKTAAEFSFFLAIPTMLGATTLDLFKARGELTHGDWAVIAVGFTVSFIVALAVIKPFVAIVQKYGLTPFAWYRLAAGMIGLAAWYGFSQVG